MPRDDHGAAFRTNLSERIVKKHVQCIDDTLNAAAPLHVNYRIGIHRKDVASAKHIRASEPYPCIAVGVRSGSMHELNPFTVEVRAQFVIFGMVRIGGPQSIGKWSGTLLRSRHSQLDIFVGVDHRTLTDTRKVSGNVAARDGAACFSDLFITAIVIRIISSIDDETNGLWRRRRRTLGFESR